MKVTVIITTFKRTKYLEKAIYSVIKQSHQDYECIVVNDYPGDANIIYSMIAELNDKRFKLVQHQKSKGGNAARNSGVAQANGSIIAFLDDDDIWLPDKLSKHIEKHVSSPDVGLIYSDFILFWDNNILPPKRVHFQPPPSNPSFSMLRGEFWPSTTSCITVRKQCFADCGLFDEELSSFQDWDMWLRISKIYPIENLSDPLAVLRQRIDLDRTSLCPERRLKGLEQIISKWSKDISNINNFRNKFKKELYMNLVRIYSLQNKKGDSLNYLFHFINLLDSKQDIISVMKMVTMIFFTHIYKKKILYKNEHFIDPNITQIISKMI